MTYQVLIFSKNDLKIIIIGTVFGGVLQFVCWKYLKNHPELLKNQNSKKVEPLIKNKKPGLRRFLPRGGAFIEITGAKLVFNTAAVLNFIANKGAWTGLFLTSATVTLKKIPSTALTKYVRDALPHTHSDSGKLETKQFTLVDGEKIYLDDCHQNFRYLFKMLRDQNISITDKKELTHKILIDYLDLKATCECLPFILCIVNILHVFAIQDASSYLIMTQNLIEAVKEGKIPKQLARVIIKKLINKECEVNPELMDVASFRFDLNK